MSKFEVSFVLCVRGKVVVEAPSHYEAELEAECSDPNTLFEEHCAGVFDHITVERVEELK